MEPRNCLPLTLHWQYGGATNIFSAFCSLFSFGFGRRNTEYRDLPMLQRLVDYTIAVELRKCDI